MRKWFYTTWLGNLYFEFLLWYDRTFNKHEISDGWNPNATIQRQNSLYTEGILKMKRGINKRLKSRTTEDYRKELPNHANLIALAENELDPVKETLKKAWVFKGKDIKNDVEMAKMIEKRIDDYKELWHHKKSRELLRAIRKAKVAKDLDLAVKLEKEWRALNGRN